MEYAQNSSPHDELHTSTGRWNVALWIVQAVLAAAFLAAGGMKLTMSIPLLVASGAAWATDVPAALIYFIGIVEVMGALGLVLPSATRIRPELTAAAALGIFAIMLLAGAVHLLQGDAAFVINLVLGSMAALVAWGRHHRCPILPG